MVCHTIQLSEGDSMLRRFSDLKNFALAARDGEIGKVKEVYFDDQTWTTRYVVVDTGGWLRGRKVLIAPHTLGLIDFESELIAVHLNRAQVEDSPSIDTEKPISRQYEEEWHRYYDYPAYWLIPEAVGFASPPLTPETTIHQPRKTGGASLAEAHVNPNLRSSNEVTGYSIHAIDGDIGHVADFIIDEEGWSIRYIVISLSRWVGKDLLMSPEWIERICWEDEHVYVPLMRVTIREAPEWDESKPISREFENRLFEHYGRPGYWPIEL